jgi:hypothetical protein
MLEFNFLSKKRFIVRYAFLFPFTVFGILSVLYCRITADEGWYTFVSNAVYDGYFPYDDFLFTQMPFLPYVYGIVMQFGMPSLVVGRWVSFCFGLLSVVLVLSIYHNDNRRQIVSGLLLTFNLSFIYDTTIFKTQSLTVMLSAAALFFLVRRKNMFLWGLFFINLAIMTRLSMLPAILFFWGYAFITNRNKIKSLLFLMFLNIFVLAILFFTLNYLTGGNFAFGVLEFHDEYYPSAKWTLDTLARFSVNVCKNQGVIVVLTPVAGLVAAYRLLGRRSELQTNNDDLIALFSFCCWISITIIHATRKVPYATYQTSNIVFAITTITPVFTSLLTNLSDRMRKVIFVVFTTAILSTMQFQEYPIRFDGSGTLKQHEKALTTLENIKRHGVKTILTFNPELAAETGLVLLSGYELGPFSYFRNMDDIQSKQKRVANERRFITDIERQRADILAITGENLLIMLSSGNTRIAGDFFSLIKKNYTIEKKIRNFGQYSDTLFIGLAKRKRR